MRNMRRAFQALDEKECTTILEKTTSGTLACMGDDVDWNLEGRTASITKDGDLQSSKISVI